MGSFPESVRVRTKHVEKTRVDLWVSQSAIMKAVWDVTRGSGTNQVEAGGHVTPPLGGHIVLKADERQGVVRLLAASRKNRVTSK